MVAGETHRQVAVVVVDGDLQITIIVAVTKITIVLDGVVVVVIVPEVVAEAGEIPPQVVVVAVVAEDGVVLLEEVEAVVVGETIITTITITTTTTTIIKTKIKIPTLSLEATSQPWGLQQLLNTSQNGTQSTAPPTPIATSEPSS